MTDFDTLIKREFLEEALELLEAIEKLLLAGERGAKRDRIVTEVFRLMHTLKGSGLSAGFADLAQLAHAAESVLDQLRAGGLAIEGPVVELLLKSTDTLKQYVGELVGNHGARLDARDLIDDMRALLAEPSNDSAVVAGGEASCGGEDGEGLFFGIFDEVAPTATPSASAEPLVVVVDDEPDMIEIYRLILASASYRIEYFTDPQAALNFVSANAADLIITDLKMPDMDGLTMIDRINKVAPGIPVIFCSGYAERNHIARFIELGVYDFIEKPFDSIRLLVAAQNGLKQRRTRQALEKVAALNFRSYVLVAKAVLQLRDGDVMDAEELIAKSKACLAEIGTHMAAITAAPQATFCVVPKTSKPTQ